jgi:hypothetical protein
MDLKIGSDQPIITASIPVIPKVREGKFRAEFRSEEEARQFLRSHPKATNVEIKLVESQRQLRLPVTLSFGPDVRQLAAKMCIALSRLVPTLEPEEVTSARDALNSEAVCKRQVLTAFNEYSLDEYRPQLAHTIYIERGDHRAHGVVQFFGTFQVFCQLGLPKGDLPRAFLGALDPLTGKETFRELDPLRLEEPPAFYAAKAVPAMLDRWKRRFRDAAVARGAVGSAEVTLSDVKFRPTPAFRQSSTTDFLLRNKNRSP